MAGWKSLATYQLSWLETIEVENYIITIPTPEACKALLDEASADID